MYIEKKKIKTNFNCTTPIRSDKKNALRLFQIGNIFLFKNTLWVVFFISKLLLFYYLLSVLSFCICLIIFHRFPSFKPMSFKMTCNSPTDIFIKSPSSILFSSNVHKLSPISNSDKNVSIVILPTTDTKTALRNKMKVHVKF